MTHELVAGMFVCALIFAVWATYTTVRSNWTRIVEALRGE